MNSKQLEDMAETMRGILVGLIMVLAILSTHVLADEAVSEEDREIIEILNLLENYDIVKSYDLYMNMDTIEKMKDKEIDSDAGAGEKEEEK